MRNKESFLKEISRVFFEHSFPQGMSRKSGLGWKKQKE